MKSRLVILVVGLILVGLLAACAPGGGEGAYPSRAITWIVPASPGGGIDTIARGLGSAMPNYLPGDTAGVVVKNISKPMGIRGLEVLWKTEPDGYTILNNYIDGSILQQLRIKPEWDFSKYTFIGQTHVSPFVVAVLADSPYNSAEDLSKSKETIRWGVITGDSQHLFTVLISEDLGLNSAYVGGYPGTREIPVALMRGEMDAMCVPLAVAASFVSSGDVKMLFTLHDAGHVEGVPSAKDLGYDRLHTLVSTQVLLAPPGVPQDRVDILEQALKQTIEDPNMQKWSARVKRPIAFESAADVAKKVQAAYAMYQKYYPTLAATVK